jgi:hypothetical protein
MYWEASPITVFLVVWYTKKNKKEMEIVMYWEARITRSLRTYKMLG